MSTALMTEAAWLARITDLVRLHRWRWVHFQPAITSQGSWRTPFSGHSGFPDLICVKAGRLVVAELKVGRGVVTPEQQAWLDLFASAGAEVHVWRPEDWESVCITLANEVLA